MVTYGRIRTLLKFHILSDKNKICWKSTIMEIDYETDYWDFPHLASLKDITHCANTLYKDMVLYCDCGSELMEKHIKREIVSYRSDTFMRVGKVGDKFGMFGMYSSFLNSPINEKILVGAIETAYGNVEADIARRRLDGEVVIIKEEKKKSDPIVTTTTISLKDL